MEKSSDSSLDFINLVMTIGTSAMVYLGEGVNPLSKKVTIDLAKARTNINMLVALKGKTAGNLAGEENKLLNDMIEDLEKKYVESLDLDEAVIKHLHRRPVSAPPRVKNVQDWVALVRRKTQEQNEGK